MWLHCPSLAACKYLSLVVGTDQKYDDDDDVIMETMLMETAVRVNTTMDDDAHTDDGYVPLCSTGKDPRLQGPFPSYVEPPGPNGLQQPVQEDGRDGAGGMPWRTPSIQTGFIDPTLHWFYLDVSLLCSAVARFPGRLPGGPPMLRSGTR